MSKKAFTLIELLAVIVVIAIIGLIGVYSITKIINKVRMDSLKSTALFAKKATKQYLVDSPLDGTTKEFDITPGNEYASLLEVGNDPWGNPYDYIKAVAYSSGDKVLVDLYVKSTKGCYYLTDGADTLETDPTCGSITPINLTATTNNNNSYTFTWDGGIAPFALMLDNNEAAKINNRTHTYKPPLGSHQIYVKSQSGQVSGVSNVNIYEELGGSNVIAADAFSKGWYLVKSSGTVAGVSVVNDTLLNKDVIEATMSTKADWGSVLKFNSYSGETKPVFNPGVKYRISFKARLISGTAGRYFAVLETDGTNSLWQAPYYNLNTSWQTFTVDFVAGTEGPSPVFYHYMALNSTIRLADLGIKNVIE